MARRPNPGDYVSNWRSSDLPLGSRLARLVKNNTKKMLTLSTCCGNHGEPGC